MSFNLSDLLNPAPTGDQPLQEERRASLTSLKIPADSQDEVESTTMHNQSGALQATSDAAHTLASLSSNSASGPPTWNAYSSQTYSPVATHEASASAQQYRRQSIYGEHQPQLSSMTPQSHSSELRRSSGEFPLMPAATYPRQRSSPSAETSQYPLMPTIPTNSRKMSSPSLEHYHVASRSPEQRRASLISPGSGITLAPLQSYHSPTHYRQQEYGSMTEPQPAGQDTSELVASTEKWKKAEESAASIQDINAQREPSYTRNEPVTTQIRGPDQNLSRTEFAATKQSPTSETAQSAHSTDLKTEHSIHSSIPAFVPVPSIKREQSTQNQEILRESSIPVPTTEDMPAEEMRGKKRPAPKTTNKKGTAKKGPPSKKRKTEAGAGGGSAQKLKPTLPRTNTLKKTTSTSATPLNSSPAPRSTRTQSSAEPETAHSDEEEDDEEDSPGTPGPDDEVYCLCRRPDTGTFMIGCDGGCDDWFHGKCVGIEEKNKNLIDKYMCPNCEKTGKGVTTWKRMCRRQGCRMPARIGKKKGETPSKYCSEDCGVLFFREMLENTRGATETSSGKRGSRKKSATGGSIGDDDLGPRGGVLSAGEVKALVTAAPSIDEFKRLGDGVLSPPATPSPNAVKNETTGTNLDRVMSDSDLQRVAIISKGKDESRARHALLKDRNKFITMAKQAATRLAAEKDIAKPKEMCGYDPRVSWSEDRFNTWRQSMAGANALASGTLQTDGKDVDGDTGMTDGVVDEEESVEICTKRKCTRHHDWSKLALDDFRFELGENSERMRGLEGEEMEIRERAGLRARELKAGGGGGIAIIHEPETATTAAMDVTNGRLTDNAPTPVAETDGLGIDLKWQDDDVVSGAPVSAMTDVPPIREVSMVGADDTET